MNSIDADNTTLDVEVRPTGKRRSTKLNDWQRFFLDRLEMMLERQRELTQQPSADPELKKLISKAVYSTFLDCQAQGITELALQRIAASSSQSPSTN